MNKTLYKMFIFAPKFGFVHSSEQIKRESGEMIYDFRFTILVFINSKIVHRNSLIPELFPQL